MQKLIAAFVNAEAGSRKPAAVKLVAYLNRHPMAECLATEREAAQIEWARELARQP